MTNPQQPAQPVNVHIQTGTGEVIRIVATLMVFAGTGMLAWVIAQQGYAEKIATVLSAATVFVAGRLWSRGVLSLPSRTAPTGEPDADVDFLRNVGRSATNVSSGYLSRCPLPVLMLIGLAYGAAFLGLRVAITAALTVFQNMFIAGAVALVLGSIVVMPGLFPRFFASLKSKGVVRPEQMAPAPIAQPMPQQPVPSYQPQQAHAPQPIYPQQPVAPAPAPTKRVVRRVVVKKETPDA